MNNLNVFFPPSPVFVIQYKECIKLISVFSIALNSEVNGGQLSYFNTAVVLVSIGFLFVRFKHLINIIH